jgi:hypothetical protein
LRRGACARHFARWLAEIHPLQRSYATHSFRDWTAQRLQPVLAFSLTLNVCCQRCVAENITARRFFDAKSHWLAQPNLTRRRSQPALTTPRASLINALKLQPTIFSGISRRQDTINSIPVRRLPVGCSHAKRPHLASACSCRPSTCGPNAAASRTVPVPQQTAWGRVTQVREV